MRDLSILNARRPKNRCDILYYVVLTIIVNSLFGPICAKDGAKSKSRESSYEKKNTTTQLLSFIVTNEIYNERINTM